MEIKLLRGPTLGLGTGIKRYDILVNGENTHYSESEQFSLLYQSGIYIVNPDDTIKLQYKIKHSFTFFPAYTIIPNDGNTYHLKTINFWKGHFRCSSDNDSYDIYYNRKSRFSVYENYKQIAYFTPTDRQGIIFANDNSNQELLMAIAITIDRGIRFILFNFLYNFAGMLAPLEMEFDNNWQPM